MVFDVHSLTLSLTSVNEELSVVCVGGVGGVGFAFVLWVFVIENLNKGN